MKLQWASPIVNVAKEDISVGLVPAVFNFFNGRATAFALAFFVCGTFLAFEGKLTTAYVGLATSLQALILAHSFKEDVHEQRMARLEKQSIDVDSQSK